MIKVNIKLDYLTSLLVSFHILHAPTELNRRYNPEIFQRFEKDVDKKVKKKYIGFVSDQFKELNIKVFEEKTDEFKRYLFFPEYDSLEAFLNGEGKKITPKWLVKPLHKFDIKFKQYWEEAKQELEGLVQERLKIVNKHIDKIYSLSEKFSHEKLYRPGEIEIRIVDGMSPSSFAAKKDKINYILMQAKNFKDEKAFLGTLIHITAPHHMAGRYRNLQKEVLGVFIFSVQEGFAKLFVDRVRDNILTEKSKPIKLFGLERTYEVYEKNWNKLANMSFGEWYKMCLVEIKEKFKKEIEEKKNCY
jgi:hypothetical protein